VAQLIGVWRQKVRSYVRAGFVAPVAAADGEATFSFQDVVLLRTARGLESARISPARVRRALLRLKERLPDDRPLSGVAIAAEGNRIVVHDGRARFEPESGQVLFDFRVGDLQQAADDIATLKPKRQKSEPDIAIAAAEQWFEIGCAREDEGDVAGALSAYREAIAASDAHADAHSNLGRLLCDDGDAAGALPHYDRALALRPNDALATFNLGVALDELGRLDQAASSYLRALELDPRAADAHYNLAGVYERLGDRAGAIRHLRAYKKLTGR
jgi:tetratricopeptide (TPR) repeat protein